ncbi:MAG: hypothetical protein QGF59_20230 [Pirellulaceae bacterium]|nr:hypothetical protein [Pirellulaceae bacterium]
METSFLLVLDRIFITIELVVIIHSSIERRDLKSRVDKDGGCRRRTCRQSEWSPRQGERCVRLAAKPGVEVVATFSGCSSGAPGDKQPNWGK